MQPASQTFKNISSLVMAQGRHHEFAHIVTCEAAYWLQWPEYPNTCLAPLLFEWYRVMRCKVAERYDLCRAKGRSGSMYSFHYMLNGKPSYDYTTWEKFYVAKSVVVCQSSTDSKPNVCAPSIDVD